MKTSITTQSLRLYIALVLAASFIGAPGIGAAQFIDTGTPAPTQEADSGGDWGNLLPARSGSDAATPEIAGDLYVLPSSGVEVVVGPGVTTDASAESDVPDQIIVETDAGLGAVAVLDGYIQPIDTLETYVDGFGETMDAVTEIDVRDSGDVATGIYRVETEGLVVYMFISVDAEAIDGYSVIEVVVAESVDMESSIVQIRENVMINGVPAFAGVDDQDIVEKIASDEG